MLWSGPTQIRRARGTGTIFCSGEKPVDLPFLQAQAHIRPGFVVEEVSVVRRLVCTLAAAAMLAAIGLGTSARSAQAGPFVNQTGSTRVYLVVMREAPVASYHGGTGSFAPTAPRPGQRFDNSAAAAVAYRTYLTSRQATLLDRLGNPAAMYSYTTALNGFAAALSADQVKTLQSMREVLLVEADSRVSLEGSSALAPRGLGRSAATGLATADAARNALWRQVGGPEKAGQGVVIGVIDTGLWPDNPSLAGLPVDAGELAASYPGFSGICQPGAGWRPATCSSKVVAARYFVAGFGRSNVATSDYLSPRDASGHGTGVAAIAAGNAGVDTRIGHQDFGHISGLAPAAALSIYKACWTAPDPAQDGCDVADTVKAIDQAVADGVDVINYSIGDLSPTLADPVQLALMNAAAANVFVAAPAGNGGPAPSTVQFPAPWATTTGANTQSVFEGGVRLGSGTTVVGAMLSNKQVGPSPLVYAGDVAAAGVSAHRAALCYPTSLDAQRVDGAIVVCDRGVTSRVSKSAAVAQAGGRAMVLVNTVPGSVDADLHRVPTVHLDTTAAARVKAYLDRAGQGATATIVPSATDHPPVPVVADFSGRGPAEATGGDILKPDLTAPGVSIISAVTPTPGPGQSGSDQQWDVQSGTSVATPHVAGVAAVVRAVHPAWSPAATKSAMLTTATALRAVSSPLDRGAGELDPTAVLTPGLVYDAGADDWAALLDGQGLRIAGLSVRSEAVAARDVNAASISVGDLVGRQTVSRSVTNVGSTTERYTAQITGLHGVANSVTPDTLTLRPGGSARFTITFSATKAARYDVFATGSLSWHGSSGRTVTSPVAVRPELASTPAEIAGSGRAGSIVVRAVAGVTGTIRPATPGLVGATPQRLSLRAGTFDPASPATSPATRSQTLTVPAGARAARFQVTSHAAGDDLDLYVYRGQVLVASATGGAGDETVTMTRPAAGDYQVYVTAHHTAHATARATFTGWVLPRAAQGNLELDHHVGVSGDQAFSVMARWSGLDPRQRWWGYVAYRGLPGVTYVTLN